MTSRNGRRGREWERCVNAPVGRGRYETMSRRGSECATAGAARVRRVRSTLTGARRSAKAFVDIGCEPLVYRQNLLSYVLQTTTVVSRSSTRYQRECSPPSGSTLNVMIG